MVRLGLLVLAALFISSCSTASLSNQHQLQHQKHPQVDRSGLR